MFQIGVISDTHGFLDPEIRELFAGVDHILHAGDVGPRSAILELEQIAPVTAVLGNTDSVIGLRLTEVAELAGHRFLLHHIVNPHRLGRDVLDDIARIRPHAVVFGHTHKSFCETVDGVLFFNPGYAGCPKPGQERGVARLDCDASGIRPRFLKLWS